MRYTPEQWQLIEALGAKLGATSEQMRKWRSRGVAGRWQARLIAASRGKIKASLFVEEQAA
jgi:hypothetical protein